ncbi:MAG: ferritin-like domain-containing protein [Brasilonema angustatum HA4187-MV1]|jgi:rubrerythrin|nr:ferritin-like domain-containing protein [Brasilonema angustatum HA4187-MV1]
MNLLNYTLYLICSGASAYLSARNIRDPLTRRQALAEYQVGESGTVPYLKALSQRATKENNSWLAKNLGSHAADEDRHGKIFGHALKQILEQEDKNQIKRLPEVSSVELTPSGTFYTAYLQGYHKKDLTAETIDWMVFLGSLYILELDASKEFVRMANVLPEDDRLSANLKKAIMSVANDEVRHAAYLYEAMGQRLSPSGVEQLIDEWRTRQVKASLATASSAIFGGQKSPPLPEGVLYSWI